MSEQEKGYNFLLSEDEIDDIKRAMAQDRHESRPLDENPCYIIPCNLKKTIGKIAYGRMMKPDKARIVEDDIGAWILGPTINKVNATVHVKFRDKWGCPLEEDGRPIERGFEFLTDKEAESFKSQMDCRGHLARVTEKAILQLP